MYTNKQLEQIRKHFKETPKELIKQRFMELYNENNKCNHKYEDGKSALGYCSIYEMRESDMYCKICGKEGNRKELEDDRLISFTEPLKPFRKEFKFVESEEIHD